MDWLRVAGVTGLLVIVAACGQPTPTSTRVGLVLHFEAVTAEGAPPTTKQLEQLRSTLERRLRDAGVGGVVELEDGGRFIVNTPDVADPEAVRTLVTSTARLEFIPMPADRYGSLTAGGPLEPPRPGDPIPKELPALLTGSDLLSVGPSVDPTTGLSAVEFQLGPGGSRVLADHTGAHIGEYLAIALDRQALLVPSISGAIPDGGMQITVTGGQEETERLVALLQNGELPFIVREVR